jgi:hypothetical protein
MTIGRKIFLIYILLFAAATGLFVHYYTPASRVVTITGAESKLSDKDGIISARNPQDGSVKDVYYISARDKNEKPMMYRNEDFPWFFKFNSNSIQAQAQSIMQSSTKDQPQYAILVSYGWHSDIFNMFKNILSLKPTDNAEASTFSFYTLLTIGGWISWILLIGLQTVAYVKFSRWREEREFNGSY